MYTTFTFLCKHWKRFKLLHHINSECQVVILTSEEARAVLVIFSFPKPLIIIYARCSVESV